MAEVIGEEAPNNRGLLGRVALGATATLLLNVGSLVLNFASTLLLSRLLGAEGYGAYAFALAWALILTSVAGLGLSPLVIRQVAASSAKREWGAIRGMLRWSNALVVVASLVATVAAAAIGLALLRDDSKLFGPFLVGLLLVVPLSLTTLRQSAMQGVGRVILGRVPESLVAPGLLLVLVATVGLGRGDAFSAKWAMAMQVLATVCAFILGALLLARSLPADARVAAPEVHAPSWRRSALPLFALGLLFAANAQLGTIVLGVLGDTADVGVYSVATRLTAFIGFVMLAATYPLMPVVARLHAEGSDSEMRRLVAGAARTIFLLSLPLALGVVVFAEPLLALFGAEFGAGIGGVRLLAVGELMKAFVGLAGLVLVMTGHEAVLMRSVAAGVLANGVLALGLVPVLGVEGAALAAVVGIAVTQLLLEFGARKRVGVSGAAFTPLHRRE